MGFFKEGPAKTGAGKDEKGIDFSNPEKLRTEVRVIGAEETSLIQEAFDMLTTGSWTAEELAGFDLIGELQSEKTHRVGLFAKIDGTEKLIGFAGASPLGTPHFKGTNEYPKDTEDIWCGYFVLHPDFRNRIDTITQLKSLHDAVLGYALGVTEHTNGRIFACTEKDLVRTALPRLGWIARGETSIVDKNGENIGMTSVYEYPDPIKTLK